MFGVDRRGLKQIISCLARGKKSKRFEVTNRFDRRTRAASGRASAEDWTPIIPLETIVEKSLRVLSFLVSLYLRRTPENWTELGAGGFRKRHMEPNVFVTRLFVPRCPEMGSTESGGSVGFRAPWNRGTLL
jgi:hypothetical protein